MSRLHDSSEGNNSYSFWKNELPLIGPSLAITLLGILLLSGSEPDYLTGLRPWLKQTIWCGLGVCVCLALGRIPVSFFIRISPLLYVLTLGLIISLRWFGTEKGGAVSWIDIGPLRLQPSEMMKISTVLLLARVISPINKTVGFPSFLLASGLAAMPSVFILLQPDLGTALVFPGILLASLYGSVVPRRYITLILIPLWAMIALPGEVLTWIIWGAGISLWLLIIAWRGETPFRLTLFLLAHVLTVFIVVEGFKPLWTNMLKPHQRDRIVGFMQQKEDDTRNLSPAAYHLRQSLIAISSGGMAGQGIGKGLQSSHGFIPMMRTDFIFAVLAEETGFIGCGLLFALIVFLLHASLSAGYGAGTWREVAVVFGLLGMWLTHVFVNLGMTMGLMPITGIPFPFLSYGGSSLLTNYTALGLILSVARRRRKASE